MSDTLDAVVKKYPQYARVLPNELAEAIGNKFPTYLQSDPEFAQEYAAAKAPGPPENPESGVVDKLHRPDPALAGAQLNPAEQKSLADFVKAQGPMPEPVSNWQAINTPWSKILTGRNLEEQLRQRYHDAYQKEHPDANEDEIQKNMEGTTRLSRLGAGTHEAVDDLADSINTPLGWLTFGLGGLPKLVQKGLALTFAARAVSEAPAQAKEFVAAVKSGDPAKIARTTLNLGGNTLMAGAMAKHGLTPEPTMAEQAAGMLSQNVRNAKFTGETAPAPIIRDQSLIEPLPKNASEAIAKGPSGTKFAQPVEVPGTPPEPERNLTVIEEIRQKKADTNRKIQQLYPQAQLTREQAAVFRRLAFPQPGEPNATQEGQAPVLEQRAGNGEGGPPAETGGSGGVPRGGGTTPAPETPEAGKEPGVAGPVARPGELTESGQGPNPNGVYQPEESLKYKGKKAYASIDLVKMRSGAWLFDAKYQHHTGNMQGMGGPLMAYEHTQAPTRAAAIVKAAEALIRQNDDENFKRGGATDTRRKEAENIRNWAQKQIDAVSGPGEIKAVTPGAETITGPASSGDEQTGSEMPAERVQRPPPDVTGRTRAAPQEDWPAAEPQPEGPPTGSASMTLNDQPSPGYGAATATMAAEPQRAGPSLSERQAANLRAKEQAAGPLPKAEKNLAAAVVEIGKAPGAKWFQGLRRIFAPQTLDESGANMAGILRAALGAEWANNEKADAALAEFRKEFDRTPVPRGWAFRPGEALPRNYEVMRAIDTGDVSRLAPAEKRFAETMRKLFDGAIDLVQEVSPNSLRSLVENYFPRLWRDPAENARAISALLSHRPWEGPKSFLKQRVLQYFTDGLKMGLQPVSDNPVDVTLQKLGEMFRFAATRRAIEEARANRLRKFVYVYEEKPEGWRTVDDPSSQVWKPPVVTVKEAYDAQMRAKSIEFLQAIGVRHERLVNIGGKRWGYAEPGGKVVTKFGGPDSVIWHEAGHQLDWQYPDLRQTLKGTRVIQNQLRALADLRAEGQQVSDSYRKYLHKTEEKMANVFDAYVRAPDRFRTVAPDVWKKFHEWLYKHPEVKNPLEAIRPSLTLTAASSEMFVGGPIKLGDWMMPEGAAQVLDNYLQPGLGRFATFRGLRTLASLQSGIQLAGFFHGQFVMNDSFYSGLGLAAYDVLNRRPVRALKELAQVPVSPFTSLYRGMKIRQAIRLPEQAEAQYARIARLAVETNLRAGHGTFDPQLSRRWIKAMREARTSPSTGAVWESLWRAPLGVVELAMKPVMQYLVPNMKLGIFARMAERVIADNPDMDQRELRKRLAMAADATEDRLGQITYDNLFQRRAVKDMGQLAFRAYGWQLTKYRMETGGAADWIRAASAVAKGQKPEVTFRMTYLPAMAMGHAALGATIMYALTGHRPKELKDYLFPQTGLKDPQGNPVRVSIADFVKDNAADWRSFPNLNKMGGEWSRKLAPFWSMAAEMYRNEDFWGTQIFSPKEPGEPNVDHLLRNLGEGANYLAKEQLPFSVTSGNKFIGAGASPTVAHLAAFLGYNPAPKYATQTPAEALAADLTQGQMPNAPRSQSSAARGQAFSELVRDIASGQPASPPPGTVRNKADMKQVEKRLLMGPFEFQVSRLPLVSSMQVWDLASDKERAQMLPLIQKQLLAATKSHTVAPEKISRYAQLLSAWAMKQAAQPPQGKRFQNVK